jgi:hypothetical protein
VAKSIELVRVTSANTTDSTKISVVNHKQLSKDIIDNLGERRVVVRWASDIVPSP